MHNLLTGMLRNLAFAPVLPCSIVVKTNGKGGEPLLNAGHGHWFFNLCCGFRFCVGVFG